jgi:hypothetical protein
LPDGSAFYLSAGMMKDMDRGADRIGCWGARLANVGVMAPADFPTVAENSLAFMRYKAITDRQAWVIGDLEKRLALARRSILADRQDLRRAQHELNRQIEPPAPSQVAAAPDAEHGSDGQIATPVVSPVGTPPDVINLLHMIERSRGYRLLRKYYAMYGLPVIGPILRWLRQKVGMAVKTNGPGQSS